MAHSRPHVVIVGAGFGGLYTAVHLLPQVRAKEIDLTIINRTNYFLFTPLLHEAATGGLSPTSVAEPLRDTFSGTGVRFIQADVKLIDTQRRVIMAAGAEIPFDYAVVATGAQTHYMRVQGANEYALGLKTVADAVHIRDHVISAFERASVTTDAAARRRELTFVVVGGGATGVELVAELVEFTHEIASQHYAGKEECAGKNITIELISATPDLLNQFHPTLRQDALRRLKSLGVSVRTNTTASVVTAEGITCTDGTHIPSATVIWAAGVVASVPAFSTAPELTKSGRLSVDPHFRLPQSECVFALGDVAAYMDAQGTEALPLLAQVAVQEAKVVAKNIMLAISGKPLLSFTYHSRGSLVSLGQWYAVGDVFSLKLRGKIAWWLWRTVYLFKFASWHKRLRIAFEWTMNLFLPRDSTKIKE